MATHDPNDPVRPDARVVPARPRTGLLLGLVVVMALVVGGIAALLVTIFNRQQEARNPYVMFVELDDGVTDAAVWGVNFPRQYESFLRTVDYERTRYGGSDAIPIQKLDAYPWLRTMWAGYAFSLDYRESRGHAFTLHDQDHTERVLQRPQPGACLHCHAAIIPAYMYLGNGDLMEGFGRVSEMPWNEARQLTTAQGQPLVNHALSCVDCHSPDNMSLRITRPAFMVGIAALKRHEGIANYDVNRDATRQEMRTFVCAQCHVEYYFDPDDRRKVTYPWHNGLRVEDAERYYDDIGFSDWTHAVTGGGMLKAQHPEFELFSQGVHARAGVSCADCHMPYRREGAMKVSDHHVRSPMLNIQRSCQTCHNVPEEELRSRVEEIQDRTHGLIQRGAAALTSMIDAIAAARSSGATDAQLSEAIANQRRAQWRLDYVFSEGSHGFHAPQEAARILAEAIDYARQGEAAAFRSFAPAGDPQAAGRARVEGATPADASPPGQVGRPGGAGQRDTVPAGGARPRPGAPPPGGSPPGGQPGGG